MPPPEYIVCMNNSQLTQITYAALYKHLELLSSDSLPLCIYMTSSHILPPNACKCYQHYFPSRPIHAYPSMSTLVYYYTNVLLEKNYFQCSVDTIDNTLHRHPDIPRADIPQPPNKPQVYTALLHQYSIIYRRMQIS